MSYRHVKQCREKPNGKNVGKPKKLCSRLPTATRFRSSGSLCASKRDVGEVIVVDVAGEEIEIDESEQSIDLCDDKVISSNSYLQKIKQSQFSGQTSPKRAKIGSTDTPTLSSTSDSFGSDKMDEDSTIDGCEKKFDREQQLSHTHKLVMEDVAYQEIKRLCSSLQQLNQSFNVYKVGKISNKLKWLPSEITPKLAIQLIVCGTVEEMVALVTESKHKSIQTVAVKVLIAIVSERASLCLDQKRVVFNYGIVKLIKKCLKVHHSEPSPNSVSDTLNLAVLRLTEMFSYVAEFGTSLANSDVLQLLAEICVEQQDPDVHQAAIVVMLNILHRIPMLPLSVILPLLPVLSTSLDAIDTTTVAATLDVLFHITFSENNDMDSVYLPAVFAQENLVQRVVSILDIDTRVAVCEAANRVVGNLSGGTVVHRQALIAQGVLPALLRLLKDTNKPEIGEHISRTLMNLCYHDTPEQFDPLVNHKVLRKLVKFSNATQQHTDGFVALNVVFAVKNALDPATEQQVGHIVCSGGVDLLCGYLLRFSACDQADHVSGLEMALDSLVDVISYAVDDNGSGSGSGSSGSSGGSNGSGSSGGGAFSAELASLLRIIFNKVNLSETVKKVSKHSEKVVRDGALELKTICGLLKKVNF